ncbi:phage/plasmid primase, P4 family [Methylocystis sp.]|uniref:DNA primase family protein n=1 Tax=Methylocystis sp. TaxID=1911079 RepID=UPI0025D1FC44|nr:phage/plasmid primase, P4 family [Methylocystis sp.]
MEKGAVASGEVGVSAPTSDLGAQGRALAQRMAAEAATVAKPKPEPEAVPAVATAVPAIAPESKVVEVAKVARTLDVAAPFEVARCFVVDRYSVGGVPTLRRWRGDWLRWTGTYYAVVGRETLEAEVYSYLNDVNGGKFDPSERDVNQVIHALKSRVLLADEVEGGTWLDGDAPWGDGPIICCKNGVLALRGRRLWPHDPRLFNLNAIETEYRDDAQALRWMQFLEEVWAEDYVSCDALQEFFGLVLTDETKFQKGFIIVGPARSGKGTIARVLSALLGPKNFCGPSLNQLSQQFGMQSLIGKKLAVVPDARLDNRANRSVITEKLLSIIGEDVQEINRKNREYWSGILRLRVMILSNELPDFKDDTGVIATRFVILQTMNSFLGREDPELSEKLRAELSGILNWALEGWARLAKQGKFIAPGNGELNEELSSNASAVKAFALECCEFGDGFTVAIDTAYNAYRNWCEGNGAQSWADRLPVNQFSGKLRSAFPGRITVVRPRDGGTRKRVFAGLRLRRHS